MIVSLINEFSFRAKLVFYLGTQQGKFVTQQTFVDCMQCARPVVSVSSECTTPEPLLTSPAEIAEMRKVESHCFINVSLSGLTLHFSEDGMSSFRVKIF